MGWDANVNSQCLVNGFLSLFGYKMKEKFLSQIKLNYLFYISYVEMKNRKINLSVEILDTD